nr:transcriptional regulator [Pyrolobus fumarii]
MLGSTTQEGCATIAEYEGETLRKRIISLLKESSRPLTAREIGDLLGLDPREEKRVYEEIMHAAKSLARQTNLRIYMVPPRCAKCGYTFTDLKKAKKPSRCPKCKSERILPPAFYIDEA